MGRSNRCGQRGRPKKLAGSRDKFKLLYAPNLCDGTSSKIISSNQQLLNLFYKVGNVILGKDIFPPFEQPSSYNRGDIRGAFKVVSE